MKGEMRLLMDIDRFYSISIDNLVLQNAGDVNRLIDALRGSCELIRETARRGPDEICELWRTAINDAIIPHKEHLG